MNDEWYTPPHVIEKARRAMGSIYLDPCSNEIANDTVQAKHYYTMHENGLDKQWAGDIWINPPYSRESGGPMPWISKLAKSNYRRAMILTNTSTSTKWWQAAAEMCDAVCFFNRRLSFYDADGNKGNNNRYDQTLFYFAHNLDPDCFDFRSQFDDQGIILIS